MTDDGFNREVLTQSVEQAVQRCILRGLEGHMIIALDFYAQRKIVAALTGTPAGSSRMPSAPQAGDKLRHRTVTADEKVRGYLSPRNTGKVGMRRGVEPIAEQIGYRTSTKLTWWQADCMQDDQSDGFARRAIIMMASVALWDAGYPAGGVDMPARFSLMGGHSVPGAPCGSGESER